MCSNGIFVRRTWAAQEHRLDDLTMYHDNGGHRTAVHVYRVRRLFRGVHC